MTKKQLNAVLSAIACDDTQLVIHNYIDNDNWFNISLTDDHNRSLEMTFDKTTGFIMASGEFSYIALPIINMINDYINAVDRAEYRKKWRD